MRVRVLGMAAATLLVASGCSSDTDDVLAAWKAAGETPGEFKDAGAKLAGGECRAGRVSGLDATLCRFDSAEKARAAEEAGYALVGSAVGTSVAAGRLVLVLADPRKEDPSGRRINALAKAFQAEAR